MTESEKPENQVEEDILALSEEEIIKGISDFTSEKLADVIVMHRYLGIYADVATAAMEELAKRREGGEKFEYETYINAKLDDMPQITINLNQYSNLLKNFKGIGGFRI